MLCSLLYPSASNISISYLEHNSIILMDCSTSSLFHLQYGSYIAVWIVFLKQRVEANIIHLQKSFIDSLLKVSSPHSSYLAWASVSVNMTEHATYSTFVEQTPKESGDFGWKWMIKMYSRVLVCRLGTQLDKPPKVFWKRKKKVLTVKSEFLRRIKKNFFSIRLSIFSSLFCQTSGQNLLNTFKYLVRFQAESNSKYFWHD